jgi:hypothetical protein
MPAVDSYTVTLTRSIRVSATSPVEAAEVGARLLRASTHGEYEGVKRSVEATVYRPPRDEELEVTRG